MIKKKIKIPEKTISVIVKVYTDQALSENGLSVDKLPYSQEIINIVNETNKANLEESVNEKDVYHTLLFMRKTGRLPKVFRNKK